ncbi:DNA gyrase subunit A [Acidithiobacillus caldus]
MPIAKHIENRSVETEISKSYLDYAMSVIVGRALPDARDGLKPVHRRILYAMRELGNDWNKPYKKSARVVGDVIGKYHPHGDVAVYDSLVRMAQDFSMSLRLVDGQGNFGSVDGDSPAAMRYTEVRLQRVANTLLEDLDRDTVNFQPNYDETLQEPSVLPAGFPNLLVNGSEGIAVGMATKIPPHNLGEVINACLALIERPDLDSEDLFSYIPGPDFPTRALILGQQGFRQACRTGNGRITLRARTEIETDKKGKTTIAVTELPYQVNKARLIEGIAELVKERKIEGISDIRDESDKSGIRIAIELRKEAIPEVVLNNLYKHTALQTNFSINMVALVDGAPRTITLREALEIFLRFREDVVTRRTRFLLKKAEARAHILEGLMVALDNLDAMIALIRQAESPAAARDALCAREWSGAAVGEMLVRAGRPATGGVYRLSVEQAQAILDLRLHRLTGLERDKIQGDFTTTLAEIADLERLLADRTVLLAKIAEELRALQSQYAEPRRSEIVLDADDDFVAEDLIPDDPVIVTLSHAGYIKALSANEFRTQSRGGRGKLAASVKDGDFLEYLFTTTKHGVLLFFTDQGRVFARRGYQIPEGSRTARGRAIPNLLPLDAQEKVATVYATRADADTQGSLLMVTRQGTAKRIAPDQFTRIRSTGTRAINLREGDSLLAVLATQGEGDVLLFTQAGRAIRFAETEVREMGKTAAGVRTIRLQNATDRVTAAIAIENAEQKVLVVTSDGMGKVTTAEEFRRTARGGQGVIAARKPIAGAALINGEDEDILLLSSQGIVTRIPANSIRETGRTARGVRLMRLDAGDQILAVERVPNTEEGEDH